MAKVNLKNIVSVNTDNHLSCLIEKYNSYCCVPATMETYNKLKFIKNEIISYIESISDGDNKLKLILLKNCINTMNHYGIICMQDTV